MFRINARLKITKSAILRELALSIPLRCEIEEEEKEEGVLRRHENLVIQRGAISHRLKISNDP